MNNFIKLELRARTGYHHSDPNANAEVLVNSDRIDYYYDDAYDGYKSIISINGREFKCTKSADEIKEKIMLAEIADNLA
jgi:hypothetical protein